MGGVAAETYIGYEVDIGYNGQSVLLPDCIGPLVIPSIQLVGKHGGETTQPCAPHTFMGKDVVHVMLFAKERVRTHVNIVVLPCPSPGCPAPDMIQV